MNKIANSLIITLLSITSLFANDIFSYTPPENLRVAGTYSSEMGNGNSFHLVIMRNKKEDNFKIKPIFIKSDGTALEFEIVTLNHEPSIISHHSENEMMSFVDFNKNTNLVSVYDFNTANLTYHSGPRKIEVKKIQTIFRLDNKTVLLNVGDTMELSSIVIKGNEPLIEIKKMIPAEYHKEFKKIRQNGLDAINQTEYTLKGSINKNKIFLNLDELSFVMDDEKKGTTKIFSTLLDKDSDF
ncbi:MAG: hypothetical protein ACJAX3_000740 [Patiriisocius sp.]|jgi:hypothetical protein